MGRTVPSLRIALEGEIGRWKGFAKALPSSLDKWAFEVQMAGNFYEALTKLKHAWDKWNSRPYLVTTEEYAVPIDRWVRRITLSIPILRQKFCELLEDEKWDEYLSKAIVDICLQYELNPLIFDVGAYWFGVEELEKENKTFKFSEIHDLLKKRVSKP